MPLRRRVRAAVEQTKAMLRELMSATANEYDPLPVTPAPIDAEYLAQIDRMVRRAVRYHEMRQGDHYQATGMLVDIWPDYLELRKQRERANG
ncbi:MAG: hypothetical protein HOQ12_07520 [Gemmatimonadaceae bacterium]|nr:hypothetical protein [Gemmatimonadaceae bacterium]